MNALEAILDRINCPVPGYEDLWARATEEARETEPAEPTERREQARQIAAAIVNQASLVISDLVWQAYDRWEASLETESLDLDDHYLEVNDYDED